MLDSLFGGSLSSRLFQEVREKRGLVYSVYSFSSLYQETGLTGLYFGCRPERLEAVMETVGRELARIVSEPVPEDELQRAKEHLKGRMILGLESTSSRMTRLGKGVLTDTEILSLDELAARIEAVTPEQVLELAAELYRPATAVGGGHRADRTQFEGVVPADCLAGLWSRAGGETDMDDARIKVAVCGALGRMGSATCDAVRADAGSGARRGRGPGVSDAGAPALLGVGKDFPDLQTAWTRPRSTSWWISPCRRPCGPMSSPVSQHHVPVVVGTTGLSAGRSRRDRQRSPNGRPLPCWSRPTSRWGLC